MHSHSLLSHVPPTAEQPRGRWALMSSQPIHSRTVGTDGKTHAKWLTNRMEIHERGVRVNSSTRKGKKLLRRALVNALNTWVKAFDVSETATYIVLYT